jgi:sugar/nucleoside kinase (ribokinase family)
VLIYGSLSQHTEIGLAGWRAAVEAAQGSCLKVCDVNLRRTATTPAGERRAVEEAIAAADIVKVNEAELVRLAEWFGWRTDPIARLREGKRVVAVTAGATGSTLHAEKEIVRIPGMPSRAGGDNVGCGDAYVAILVHGMTLGWDLEASGAAASRWAAEVASQRGATPLLSEDETTRLLLGESAEAEADRAPRH